MCVGYCDNEGTLHTETSKCEGWACSGTGPAHRAAQGGRLDSSEPSALRLGVDQYGKPMPRAVVILTDEEREVMDACEDFLMPGTHRTVFRSLLARLGVEVGR